MIDPAEANKTCRAASAIAAFDAIQVAFATLVKKGILSKAEAEQILRQAIETIKTGGNGDQAAELLAGSGVPPRSARRAFILGSSRAALTSLLSSSTISAGVAFGAPTPACVYPAIRDGWPTGDSNSPRPGDPGKVAILCSR